MDVKNEVESILNLVENEIRLTKLKSFNSKDLFDNDGNLRIEKTDLFGKSSMNDENEKGSLNKNYELLNENNSTDTENDFHEILSNSEKHNLLIKGIELGFNIDNIKKCLINNDNLHDEEKFFENLIEITFKTDNKTTSNLKNINKQDREALIDRHEFNNINKISDENNDDNLLENQNKKNTNKNINNGNLRPIIIDGDDVGYSKNKLEISVRRIKLVFEYFEDRGHVVVVILPHKEAQEHEYLIDLEKKQKLFSPRSKKLPGIRIDCECDIFMLELARKNKGIIVSNNDFKKLLYDDGEKFKQIIEERVLMYSFVHEEFMPAMDPLGKNGPTLDNFLLIETVANLKICPYKKKCTYGSKCKYYHPERVSSKKQFKTAHESVLEEAQENMKLLVPYLNQKNENLKNLNKIEIFQGLSHNEFQQIKEPNKKNYKLTQANVLNEKHMDNTIHDLKQSNFLVKPYKVGISNSLIHSDILVSRSSSTCQNHSNSSIKNNLSSSKSNNSFQINSQNVNNVPQKKWHIPSHQNLQNDPLLHESNIICNQIKIVNTSNAQNLKEKTHLYERLLKRLPQNKVIEVLSQYPDETDEDKLVFLAKEDED